MFTTARLKDKGKALLHTITWSKAAHQTPLARTLAKRQSIPWLSKWLFLPLISPFSSIPQDDARRTEAFAHKGHPIQLVFAEAQLQLTHLFA